MKSASFYNRSVLCLSFCASLLFEGNIYAAHRPVLKKNEDYYEGNGRGAPVAEQVADYAHKGKALDHFSQRRVKAIKELYRASGGRRNLAVDLDKMLEAKYALLPMNPGYTLDEGEKINFLTRQGLEKCQKFLINGKFYHYPYGNRLVPYSSDSRVALDGYSGDIIVMDEQGNIFIHPKEMRAIHHSSFFSQKPIAFGAMVRIKNGVIVDSNLKPDTLDEVDLFPDRNDKPSESGLMYYSGHYDPFGDNRDSVKQRALDNFKKELEASYFAWFMIKSNAKKKEKALDARGDNFASKWVGVDTPHRPNDDQYSHQLWELVKVTDKHYMIISNRYGRALDCNGDGHGVPTEPIKSSNNDRYEHQLWKIKEVDGYSIITSKYNKKALDSYHGDRIMQHPKHKLGHGHYERHKWEIIRQPDPSLR